jgi:lipopolysaccharide biosynthesis regulator YciM
MTASLEFILLVSAGVLVVLAVVLLYRRRSRSRLEEDSYTRGLELWLAGDRQGAAEAFRLAVKQDPTAVDPYLQLGNLLRLGGDPARAAALHRGLTARPGLSPQKRISIALALTEDLLDLKRWREAEEILDELRRHDLPTPRYWRARFRQRLGAGDPEGALKALKGAQKRVAGEDKAVFRREHELFQLDLALTAVEKGDCTHARRMAHALPDDSPFGDRAAYVIVAAYLADGNYDRAAEVASEALLAHPAAVSLLLPGLRKALLEGGQFARFIPILESACEDDAAAPELWLALALMHEKVGDRERAMQLLTGHAGEKQFTPHAVAPYLRILVKDLPESDFTRLWRTLTQPDVATDCHCRACGAEYASQRWFCSTCRSFDRIGPGGSVA